MQIINILKKKAPCLVNEDIVLTEIEKDIYDDFDYSRWAKPNLEKLDACIKHYVEHCDAQFVADDEDFTE